MPPLDTIPDGSEFTAEPLYVPDDFRVETMRADRSSKMITLIGQFSTDGAWSRTVRIEFASPKWKEVLDIPCVAIVRGDD